MLLRGSMNIFIRMIEIVLTFFYIKINLPYSYNKLFSVFCFKSYIVIAELNSNHQYSILPASCNERTIKLLCVFNCILVYKYQSTYVRMYSHLTAIFFLVFILFPLTRFLTLSSFTCAIMSAHKISVCSYSQFHCS